jgi:hypothetical protein
VVAEVVMGMAAVVAEVEDQSRISPLLDSNYRLQN